MKVLFDFEIDERLKPSYSVNYYETIRSFFLQRFSSFELEMMLYVEARDYAVIIVYASEDRIQVIPLNIPYHVMRKMNRCITQQHTEMLQAELSSIEEDSRL